MEDLDEVQGLAAAAFLHHDARRRVLSHRANETGGKQQAILAPIQQVHHEGGVTVLRGARKPLLGRRAQARPRGAAPTAIAAPTRAAAASREVPVRPVTEVAPAGAVALAVAKAVTPPGAIVRAVE
jgi:hypothetical protein